MMDIESKILELETDTFTNGDTLVMIGCGPVQFIGVVDADALYALKTNDPITLNNAGIVIVQRGMAEVSPGTLRLMKEAFIASLSMGSGLQKITVRKIDFFQIPATDLEEADYLAVLEEYSKFVNTNTETSNEPRIIDPRVAAEVAHTLIRRGMIQR